MRRTTASYRCRRSPRPSSRRRLRRGREPAAPFPPRPRRRASGRGRPSRDESHLHRDSSLDEVERLAPLGEPSPLSDERTHGDLALDEEGEGGIHIAWRVVAVSYTHLTLPTKRIV